MSSSAPDTLGKYQIIREIARSNDIVYEAYDPVMHRRVAVKELAMPPGSSERQQEDRIKRFMREAKAAGSLVHPNIVTVYEVSKEGDRHYLVMEFLDGDTLRKELEREGFLQPVEAIELIIEVLQGLKFAHSNGVVHRDVKPENIQILENESIKLTDFGIARLTFEPNLTMDGQVFGTPSYMSPEQINGKDVDPRSDIFSVGVVLFEAVSGQKPFQGDSVISITHAILNNTPQQPAQASWELWSIISKAIEKAPSMRYQSAEEMITALKGVIKNLASVGAAAIASNTPPPVLLNPSTPPNPYYLPPNKQPPPLLGTSGNVLTPYGGAIPQGVPYGQSPPTAPAPNTPYGMPSQGTPIPYGLPTQGGQAYPPGGFQAPMPVYLPARERPLFKPGCGVVTGKVLIAFLIMGALVAAILLLMQAIAESFQSDLQTYASPTNSSPAAEESPVPPVSSGSQADHYASLLAQANALVEEGARNRGQRDDLWNRATRIYVEALDQPGSTLQSSIIVAQQFIKASQQLEAEGDLQGARKALYRAQGFASDSPEMTEGIRQDLNRLGA